MNFAIIPFESAVRCYYNQIIKYYIREAYLIK